MVFIVGAHGVYRGLAAHPRLLLDGAPQRHLPGRCVLNVRQGRSDDMCHCDCDLLLRDLHHLLHHHWGPVGHM